MIRSFGLSQDCKADHEMQGKPRNEDDFRPN